MGAATSKAQDDRQIAAARIGNNLKSDMADTRGHSRSHHHHHHHRSRRQPQRSASSPPSTPAGIPGQAQFGYLIQQIGDDTNQVQVTPGYYYAGYEQQSKHRHNRSHRRHDSAPTPSVHRSRHHRNHDAKPAQQHTTSSKERRHSSRRNSAEPRSARSGSKLKEHTVLPERKSIPGNEHSAAAATPTPPDDGDTDLPPRNVPDRQRSEPTKNGSSSTEPQPQTVPPNFKDTGSFRKRRDNPLPKPPKDAYETGKYRELKRSQTVDSSTPADPYVTRESKPGRSYSEYTPSKPRSRHQTRPSAESTALPALKEKSTSFDSRVEKKLPKPPPIKDRVLERLFKVDFDRREPSPGPSRNGPLSVLRSLSLPAFSSMPLKKTFLGRSESRLVNGTSRAGDESQLPPYVGPPVSIPLNSPLNPASPYEVVYKKKTYPTAAHLFEAHKFLKHNPELAERLRMVTESPSEMGKLSYSFQTEGMVREDWELVWRDKLDEVLWLKFAQHPELRDELLSTGYSLLLDGNEVRHADPDTPGVNELGKAYMRLRDRLRLEQQ